MQDLAVSGYSADEVQAALHAPLRHESFRFDLLDKDNQYLGAVDDLVRSCRVTNNALGDIKRTGRLEMTDSPDVDWLSNRVKPWVRLEMPDGNFAEWPQGVLLLSTPTREIEIASGTISRDVEAYDQGVILRDDKVLDRYTVTAGTNYMDAVETILISAGITDFNLVATDKTLPVDLDWAPGTSKVSIINDLLGAINYRALWFDQDGLAIAEPYFSPDTAPVEYDYRDDENGVTLPALKETLDTFGVPNVFKLLVSEPDRVPLTAEYINSNPSSPTSTERRGFNIVDFREEESAADQTSLDEKVARIAFEASQVYGIVEFETLIMPIHLHADVIRLTDSDLSISHKYSEHEWGFDFKAGSPMFHKVRRVVAV